MTNDVKSRFDEQMMRIFNVDDRVKFDLNGTPEYQGTGTILGLANDYILKWYIVLLDVPILGQKAIVVQNTLMRLID